MQTAEADPRDSLPLAERIRRQRLSETISDELVQQAEEVRQEKVAQLRERLECHKAEWGQCPADLVRKLEWWRRIDAQELARRELLREREVQYRRLRAVVRARRQEWTRVCCGYVLSNRLLPARGARYLDRTFSNYVANYPAQKKVLATLRRYAAELPEHVKAGRNLLVIGTVGTGKDHLLAAVARRAVLAHGIHVLWATGSALFNAFRQEVDGSDAASRRCREAAILAISDPIPPAGTLTPFVAERLFGVIDARYSARKSTWVTCNVAGRSELEQAVGVQTVDRLIDGALVVTCDWPSYRKRA